MLEQFNASLSARDTPRGLTLTLPDSDFQGARVSPAVYERLARVAAVLKAHPDLTVEVDGNENFSFERAHATRAVRIRLRDLDRMHGAGRLVWIKLNRHAQRLKAMRRQVKMKLVAATERVCPQPE